MGRKIVTGYSPKYDGLLVVTDDDLSVLAAKLGFVHKQINKEDFFTTVERLNGDELTDDQYRQIMDCEVPRGFYRIFVADFDLDTNLEAAVCW